MLSSSDGRALLDDLRDVDGQVELLIPARVIAIFLLDERCDFLNAAVRQRVFRRDHLRHVLVDFLVWMLRARKHALREELQMRHEAVVRERLLVVLDVAGEADGIVNSFV